MKLTKYLIFFLLTSCAFTQNRVVKDRAFQIELYVLAKKFYEDTEELGYSKPRHIKSIHIVDTIHCGDNEPVAGCCSEQLTNKYVRLNADLWRFYDFKYKITVLYHELLHCAYGLDHTTGTLMDPYLNRSLLMIESYPGDTFSQKLKHALKVVKP